MHRVFVYGTLKSGGRVRGLDMLGWVRDIEDAAVLVGEATTVNASFSLYDLGSFPAASIAGNNKILGEVWEVNDEMFEVLDGIEGYPTFYNRTTVKTTRGEAWMYYIPEIEQSNEELIYAEPGETVSWNE
jgi:gamma-glutamylcyclotransferase (GGCT)/AIG2-like uncharacterized protein YtfP